ncbi:hypothetical protein [Cytophaga sp. FL35]|uniref:hypothetical protein n=1 Tax=Cytophaga sp. FL35 TaxID=1904456 RepID=UPI001653C1D6|nr:hypothetical protein [Cytophaga sp. FL35]MBC6999747.1 hypothetical protein [Cytophaga sp. FL35]
MKHFFLACILLALFPVLTRAQVNDYKYVVVPKKFDGFKKENQYQTSTLVKYLFTEEGFETAYADDLPLELSANRCKALFVKLLDNSNMFTTKTSLVLEDCQGREVFMTQEGKSKEKEYKESFGEAIREAFVSVKGLNYKYSGKELNSDPVTVSYRNDVKNVEEKSKPKNLNPMVEQKATMEEQSYKDRTPKPSTLKKINQAVVDQSATQSVQSYESKTPKTTDVKSEVSSVAEPISGILYAQKLENGYQLVDSTPKIRMKIFETSMPNYYLADANGQSGVVFEKDGNWFFEYQKEGKTVTQELEIKF